MIPRLRRTLCLILAGALLLDPLALSAAASPFACPLKYPSQPLLALFSQQALSSPALWDLRSVDSDPETARDRAGALSQERILPQTATHLPGNARALSPKKIAIIIPTRDGGRLMPVENHIHGQDALRMKVRQLQDFVRENPDYAWTLILVDDGSPAKMTGQILQGLADTLIQQNSLAAGQIRVSYIEDHLDELHLSSPDESRKGGAVRLGLQEALAMGADYAVYTDADLSTDLKQLPGLLNPLKEDGRIGVVLGSRWASGAKVEGRSMVARLSSGVYNRLVRSLLPLGDIHDTQCGFKAFSAEALRDILPEAQDRRLSFDSELLLLARQHGFTLIEVPIEWKEYAQGSSIRLFQDIPDMLGQLLLQRQAHVPGLKTRLLSLWIPPVVQMLRNLFWFILWLKGWVDWLRLKTVRSTPIPEQHQARIILAAWYTDGMVVFQRIAELWDRLDALMGQRSSEEQRQTLELLFAVLSAKTRDEDLWKNAKEMLTEALESPDFGVWAPAFQRALDSLRNPTEHDARAAVIEALIPMRGRLENTAMVRCLCSLLQDPNPELQEIAAYVLGEMGPRTLSPLRWLHTALLHTSDPDVQRTIQESLYKLEGSLTPVSVHHRRSAVASTSGEFPAAHTDVESLGYVDSEGNLQDRFVYQRPLAASRFFTNPVDLYHDPVTAETVVVKGGAPYNLWTEMTVHGFFSLAGLPVPRMALLKAPLRDRQGNVHESATGPALAIEYKDQQRMGGLWLPERYHRDPRIYRAMAISLLLAERDRTPKNMLFPEATNSDAMTHIDFGAALAFRATGGFVEFPDHLNSEAELTALLQTPRLGQREIVNEAYAEVWRDPALLREAAAFLQQLSNDQIHAILIHTGTPFGENSLDWLQFWMVQLRVENKPGRWNRKAREQRNGPLRTFGQAVQQGGWGNYVEHALRQRRDDLIRLLEERAVRLEQEKEQRVESLTGHPSRDAPETTIFIPTRTRRNTVFSILDQVEQLPLSHEVIVVVDGVSGANPTFLERLRERARTLPNLTVLELPVNRGKGAAFRAALAHARGRYFVVQDADGEYPPENISRYLEALRRGEADAVYGSRVLGHQETPIVFHGWSDRAIFYSGLGLIRVLIGLLYRVCITDEGAGFKVFRVDDLRQLDLEGERFELEPELTAKLVRSGKRIIELPSPHYVRRTRNQGKSFGARDAFFTAWTLWRYRTLPSIPGFENVTGKPSHRTKLVVLDWDDTLYTGGSQADYGQKVGDLIVQDIFKGHYDRLLAEGAFAKPAIAAMERGRPVTRLRAAIEQARAIGLHPEELDGYYERFNQSLWEHKKRLASEQGWSGEPDRAMVPGARQFLDQLQAYRQQGVRVIVISNGPYGQKQWEAETLGLTHCWDAFYAENDPQTHLAPEDFTKEKILEKVLRESGISDRNEVVWIGDSREDVGFSRKGLRTVGIAKKTSDRPVLVEAGADVLIPHFRNSEPLLQWMFPHHDARPLDLFRAGWKHLQEKIKRAVALLVFFLPLTRPSVAAVPALPAVVSTSLESASAAVVHNKAAPAVSQVSGHDVPRVSPMASMLDAGRRLAFVFDVDRTLAFRGMPLPQHIVEQMVALMVQGHYVRIITGQSFAAQEKRIVQPIMEQIFETAQRLGLDPQTIAAQYGIYASSGGQKLSLHVRNAAEHTYEAQVDESYLNGKIITATDAETLTRELNAIAEKEQSRLDFKIRQPAHPEDICRGGDCCVIKIFLTRNTDNQDIRPTLLPLIRERLHALGFSTLEAKSSGSTTIEVKVRGIHKRVAIDDILATLPVHPEEVVYLGDEWNDGGNDTEVVTAVQDPAQQIRALSLHPNEFPSNPDPVQQEKLREGVLQIGSGPNGTFHFLHLAEALYAGHPEWSAARVLNEAIARATPLHYELLRRFHKSSTPKDSALFEGLGHDRSRDYVRYLAERFPQTRFSELCLGLLNTVSGFDGLIDQVQRLSELFRDYSMDSYTVRIFLSAAFPHHLGSMPMPVLLGDAGGYLYLLLQSMDAAHLHFADFLKGFHSLLASLIGERSAQEWLRLYEHEDANDSQQYLRNRMGHALSRDMDRWLDVFAWDRPTLLRFEEEQQPSRPRATAGSNAWEHPDIVTLSGGAGGATLVTMIAELFQQTPEMSQTHGMVISTLDEGGVSRKLQEVVREMGRVTMASDERLFSTIPVQLGWTDSAHPLNPAVLRARWNATYGLNLPLLGESAQDHGLVLQAIARDLAIPGYETMNPDELRQDIEHLVPLSDLAEAVTALLEQRYGLAVHTALRTRFPDVNPSDFDFPSAMRHILQESTAMGLRAGHLPDNWLSVIQWLTQMSVSTTLELLGLRVDSLTYGDLLQLINLVGGSPDHAALRPFGMHRDRVGHALRHMLEQMGIDRSAVAISTSSYGRLYAKLAALHLRWGHSEEGTSFSNDGDFLLLPEKPKLPGLAGSYPARRTLVPLFPADQKPRHTLALEDGRSLGIHFRSPVNHSGPIIMDVALEGQPFLRIEENFVEGHAYSGRIRGKAQPENRTVVTIPWAALAEGNDVVVSHAFSSVHIRQDNGGFVLIQENSRTHIRQQYTDDHAQGETPVALNGDQSPVVRLTGGLHHPTLEIVLDTTGAGTMLTWKTGAGERRERIELTGRLIESQSHLAESPHASPIVEVGLVDDKVLRASHEAVQLIRGAQKAIIISFGNLIENKLGFLLSPEILQALLEARQREIPIILFGNPYQNNETYQHTMTSLVALFEQTLGVRFDALISFLVVNIPLWEDAAYMALSHQSAIPEIQKLLDQPREATDRTQHSAISRGLLTAFRAELKKMTAQYPGLRIITGSFASVVVEDGKESAIRYDSAKVVALLRQILAGSHSQHALSEAA